MLAVTMCFASCNISDEEARRKTSSGVQSHTKLIDVTFNGETHEYVYFIGGYQGSIAHWEGCKYCKEKALKNSGSSFTSSEETSTWSLFN